MKVLLFIDKNQLAPTGGPIGYCYNIKKYLDGNDCEIEFHFLNEKSLCQTANSHGFKQRITSFLEKHARWFLNYRLYNNVINKRKSFLQIDNINQYDFIHFHTPFDFYRERDVLKGFKGKTIITSHSPIPSHLELLEDVISNKEKRRFKKLYRDLYLIDEYTFLNADYIFFPCREAEESYKNKWPRYNELCSEIDFKKRYILSGINKCTFRIEPKVLRKELGIGESDFVVSYAGRHNTTKGYDILKDIGQRMLDDNNVYFVVCGKEMPIKRLSHDRWIEIGWTKDAHSYINASNVFLLPNRDTYFDLVFLEVLSLGKIIVASKTGGNKIFEGKSRGIFLYNTQEEAISILKRLKSMSVVELNELEQDNKKLFEKEFSINVFMKNYVSLLKTLFKNT